MALTRDSKLTIIERLQHDQAFAKALLDEAADALLTGEPEIARSMLHSIVVATIGFEALARKINMSSKRVHRMLSSKGELNTDNISSILAPLRQHLYKKPHVRSAKVA